MLPEQFDTKVRLCTEMLVTKTLARTSLSANLLTILGSVLILGSIYLLAIGAFFWAGSLILAASVFDMLDGAVARVKKETSLFGAFLDSTLDRYSEGFILFGLLLFFHRTAPHSTNILLIYAAVVGSFLISYIRARAEALGYKCKVGLLERPERIILIVAGLLSGWVSAMLWLLVALSHLTALQRVVYVWRQSQDAKSASNTTNKPSSHKPARILRLRQP